MNLDDARSAKQDLWVRLQSVAGILELDRYPSRIALARGERALSAAGGSFAEALTSDPPTDAPNYAISLGVSVGQDGDYGVAVRVQASRSSRPVAEHLRHVFREGQLRRQSNIDFRMIGIVRSFKPWYQDVVRPLRVGASVGHNEVGAGTLGAFVSVQENSGEYMLSNNHVLANIDNAQPGDRILQPGFNDNLAPNQLIAGSFHSAVPLNAAGPNLVDCAIAKIDPLVDIDPGTLWNVGKLDGTIAADQAASALVFKIGRTTGLSWGRVTAFELDPIEIQMGAGVYAFHNQIEIEGTGSGPFSRPGDSGSLVIDTQYRAVGLLFAGSTSGGSNGRGLTFVNPIQDVLDGLKARLVY